MASDRIESVCSKSLQALVYLGGGITSGGTDSDENDNNNVDEGRIGKL